MWPEAESGCPYEAAFVLETVPRLGAGNRLDSGKKAVVPELTPAWLLTRASVLAAPDLSSQVSCLSLERSAIPVRMQSELRPLSSQPVWHGRSQQGQAQLAARTRHDHGQPGVSASPS